MEKTAVKKTESKNLLKLIKDAQQKYGYLSSQAISEVAGEAGVSVGKVYSTASFYSFISTEPRGKNVIRVCNNLSCEMHHQRLVLEALKKELGIEPGKTTSDWKFSLEFTNCVGGCDNPPAMMINDKVYSGLTPEKIGSILKGCK